MQLDTPYQVVPFGKRARSPMHEELVMPENSSSKNFTTSRPPSSSVSSAPERPTTPIHSTMLDSPQVNPVQPRTPLPSRSNPSGSTTTPQQSRSTITISEPLQRKINTWMTKRANSFANVKQIVKRLNDRCNSLTFHQSAQTLPQDLSFTFQAGQYPKVISEDKILQLKHLEDNIMLEAKVKILDLRADAYREALIEQEQLIVTLQNAGDIKAELLSEFPFLCNVATHSVDTFVNDTVTLIQLKQRDLDTFMVPELPSSQRSDSSTATSAQPPPTSRQPNNTNPYNNQPNRPPTPQNSNSEMDELKEMLKQTLKLQQSLLQQSKNESGRGRDTTPRRRPYHDRNQRSWSPSRSRSPYNRSYQNNQSNNNGSHNNRPRYNNYQRRNQGQGRGNQNQHHN